jgi:aspartyl-tRNA synthetase
MGIAEGFIQKVYREILGIEIPLPLRRMTWQEGMERFGSDKPDLRFGMELTDVSECLKDTEFKVFSGALKTGSVRGINLKGQAQALSRKEIDKLGEWVKSYGAKGLAWTRLAEKETSSFEKFLKAEEVEALRKKMDAQPGDVLFFVADPKNKVVFDTLGALRCELAHRFNLIDDSKPCLLWITDFPLFEYSEEEGRFMAMHHPFTMPNPEDLDKLESDPGSVRALAYDMVLNGNEVGGGSIRINDSELQRRMFKALGFTPEEAQRRFGFLIDAFRFGAPPHGGMAFGLDRLVMLMLNCDSIRDVIAFPKVASSAELMSEAPTEVDQKQLNELGIQIAKQK